MPDWRSILVEHGPAVWRTVYRLLDHHADALDCYQETFLAAWQFAQRQNVDDWASLLTSIATRRAIDQLRSRLRSRARFQEIDRVTEPSSEVDNPFRHVSAKELMDRVRQGMAELPEKQAEVFWLSCIEGLAHAEIAERLQIPAGEVRVLLHRARVRLREALDLGAGTKGEDDERKSPTQS